MKKIALVLIFAFVSVSLASLLMGIEMDYRSELMFNSILLLLVSISLDFFKLAKDRWARFLRSTDINNRNYKKTLLVMDDISFRLQKDIIMDLPDKDRSKKLFNIYEEIRLKRKKNKKTHNV